MAVPSDGVSNDWREIFMFWGGLAFALMLVVYATRRGQDEARLDGYIEATKQQVRSGHPGFPRPKPTASAVLAPMLVLGLALAFVALNYFGGRR